MKPDFKTTALSCKRRQQLQKNANSSFQEISSEPLSKSTATGSSKTKIKLQKVDGLGPKFTLHVAIKNKQIQNQNLTANTETQEQGKS